MKPLSEDVRKHILHNWHNEKGVSIRNLAKRLKLPPTTVYDTIKHFADHYSFKDLPGRGRKIGSYDKKVDKTMRTIISKHRSISVHYIARKSKTTKSTVQDVKRRHGLTCYKKQKIAKILPGQL